MPPAPVSVADAPRQTEVVEEVAVMVGFELTVIETVVVFEQPALVPVTVYTVLVVGLTATLAPVKAPGFHVYDEAPEPVKVVEEPKQIAVGEAVAITVGFGVILRLTVELDEHPSEEVAATVYIVVTVGLTAIVLVVTPPGFHV
jgi:hypothetical protein